MSTFILKRKQETKSEAKQRDTTEKFHQLSGGQTKECSKAAEPRRPTNHANQSPERD